MLGFFYFFAVFLVSIFSFRWLYRAARASAGVSFEEKLRYHRSVRHQPRASRHVARWLVRKSSQPRRPSCFCGCLTWGLPLRSCAWSFTLCLP